MQGEAPGWHYKDGSRVEAPEVQHAGLLHALEQQVRTREASTHGLPPTIHKALSDLYQADHDTEPTKAEAVTMLMEVRRGVATPFFTHPRDVLTNCCDDLRDVWTHPHDCSSNVTFEALLHQRRYI